MKASDIVLQLMELIPQYSSDFSESWKPSAVTVLGTTVTVTRVAHELIENQIISVVGAEIINPISGTSFDDGITTLIASGQTDLTYGWQENEKVKLSSASTPSIDGEYTLEAVQNRTTFQISGMTEPIPTDLILHEVRDYSVNGLFRVSVVDADTFTYQLQDDDGDIPGSFAPAIDPDSMNVHWKIRISAASQIERMIENYDKQPPSELWLCVILGDNDINKSSGARSDADMEQGNMNQWNGLLISPFNVYSFETIDDITGRGARDNSEDIRPLLYRSLLGKKFDTGFANQADSSVYPVGDGAHEYRKSYYIHRFQFAQLAQIADSDTLYESKTSALRDLQFDFLNTMTDNGEVIISTKVNLDVEP